MEFLSILFILAILAFFILIFSSRKIRGGLKFGIFFITLGLLLWLENMNLLPYLNVKRDWPWIFVFLGLLIVVKSFSRKSQKNAKKKIQNVLKDLEAGKITPEEAEKKIKRLK